MFFYVLSMKENGDNVWYSEKDKSGYQKKNKNKNKTTIIKPTLKAHFENLQIRKNNIERKEKRKI